MRRSSLPFGTTGLRHSSAYDWIWGCEVQEIVELCLEDIDWRAGTFVIRKNKQRRERLLPLPPLVAKAILSYLRTGRPSSSSRRLFFVTGYRWAAHDRNGFAVKFVGSWGAAA